MLLKPWTSISAGSSCSASSSIAQQIVDRASRTRCASAAASARGRPRGRRVAPSSFASIHVTKASISRCSGWRLPGSGIPRPRSLRSAASQTSAFACTVSRLRGVQRHASGLRPRVVAADAVGVDVLRACSGPPPSGRTCPSTAVVTAATATPMRIGRFMWWAARMIAQLNRAHDAASARIDCGVDRHEQRGPFPSRQHIAGHQRAHHPHGRADVRALEAQPPTVVPIRPAQAGVALDRRGAGRCKFGVPRGRVARTSGSSNGASCAIVVNRSPIARCCSCGMWPIQ